MEASNVNMEVTNAKRAKRACAASASARISSCLHRESEIFTKKTFDSWGRKVTVAVEKKRSKRAEEWEEADMPEEEASHSWGKRKTVTLGKKKKRAEEWDQAEKPEDRTTEQQEKPETSNQGKRGMTTRSKAKQTHILSSSETGLKRKFVLDSSSEEEQEAAERFRPKKRRMVTEAVETSGSSDGHKVGTGTELAAKPSVVDIYNDVAETPASPLPTDNGYHSHSSQKTGRRKENTEVRKKATNSALRKGPSKSVGRNKKTRELEEHQDHQDGTMEPVDETLEEQVEESQQFEENLAVMEPTEGMHIPPYYNIPDPLLYSPQQSDDLPSHPVHDAMLRDETLGSEMVFLRSMLDWGLGTNRTAETAQPESGESSMLRRLIEEKADSPVQDANKAANNDDKPMEVQYTEEELIGFLFSPGTPAPITDVMEEENAVAPVQNSSSVENRSVEQDSSVENENLDVPLRVEPEQAVVAPEDRLFIETRAAEMATSPLEIHISPPSRSTNASVGISSENGSPPIVGADTFEMQVQAFDKVLESVYQSHEPISVPTPSEFEVNNEFYFAVAMDFLSENGYKRTAAPPKVNSFRKLLRGSSSSPEQSPLMTEQSLQKNCVMYELSKLSNLNHWFYDIHKSVDEKGWAGSKAKISYYLACSSRDLKEPQDNVPMWPIATAYYLKAEGSLSPKVSFIVSNEDDTESPIFTENEWNEFFNIAKTGQFSTGEKLQKGFKIHGRQVDGFKITLFCEDD